MAQQFRVIGVDKESGLDTELVIEAQTPANARVKAELRGVVVTDVEGERQAPPPPVRTLPAVRVQPPPPSPLTLILRIFTGIIAAGGLVLLVSGAAQSDQGLAGAGATLALLFGMLHGLTWVNRIV